MKIAILTSTYNRIGLLRRLYFSLLKQVHFNFAWFIIDDGSKDATKEIVNEWITENKFFQIIYTKKENGGKSRAINYGFNVIEATAKDYEFVIIIDDDEILFSNALLIVENYAKIYFNTACIGMEFLRKDKNGNLMSNYPIENDFFMSVFERKRKNKFIDGYVGYYLKKLDGKRFPEYNGERYVGPGVLQMLIGESDNLLWSKEAIGETEYLPNGITKQGRRLRLKNPKGMITYCLLLQNKKAGWKIRFKYSIMGYAYMYYARLRKSELRDVGLNPDKFILSAAFPGKLLSYIWKSIYT